MKYVNVGSGTTPRKTPEYINVDIREMPNVDVVSDIRKLPFENNEFDGLLSEYSIEHLPRYEIEEIISEWVRVVKKGGWVQVTTVDLGELMDKWRKIPYDNMLDGIYGAQKYPEDLHRVGFTDEYLEHLFNICGLEDLKVIKFEKRKIPRITIKGIKI